MTRIATRDGVAYDVHDVGRGPVLVLLHGFAGSSGTWDGVTHGLAAGRRLLAIDLLGHGGSDAPSAQRHEVERQAQDVAWLVEGLAGPRVDVMGYSFGARVALWLAVLAPAIVGRLVLESPTAGIADPAARAARVAADERWATLLEAGDMAAFHDAWEAQPVFASRARLSAAARGAIREGHLAANGRALAASLRGAGQGVMRPLHERLGALATPALVIAGTLDATGLERASEVTRSLPDARVELIEDAGHAPHIERPEAFLRVVTGFLDSADRGVP
jgi:2-succinyl-6-hydroxy-2,4-cyclohexadiene-1-carboxylate synthase